MIKSEPKSILQFMASHYDLLRELFDIQVKNDIITKESLIICLENYDKDIQEQLTEYQIWLSKMTTLHLTNRNLFFFNLNHKKSSQQCPKEINISGKQSQI